MAKIIECAKVDPSSGCQHVIRGNTEDEVLKNAMEHAKQPEFGRLRPSSWSKPGQSSGTKSKEASRILELPQPWPGQGTAPAEFAKQ